MIMLGAGGQILVLLLNMDPGDHGSGLCSWVSPMCRETLMSFDVCFRCFTLFPALGLAVAHCPESLSCGDEPVGLGRKWGFLPRGGYSLLGDPGARGGGAGAAVLRGSFLPEGCRLCPATL